MALTRDEIYRIARLARLDLTAREAERFPAQLAELVGYVDRLADFEATESQPASPRAEAGDDGVRLSSLRRKRFLEQAPEARNGFLVVPEVLGGD